MITNPNEPINPTGHSQSGTGLTKREYFAALAMQALISSDPKVDLSMSLNQSREMYAREAVNIADALITELNKQP